ncbi:MAG: hypothetical protein J6Y33_01010 [Prevotella sp.]|nr:hypothetical protein [Prevotella sp.]
METTTERSTVFNPAQLYLLEMFSRVKTEKQLLEIKDVLAEYFAKKVEDGIAELESKGLWGREQSDAVAKEHLRTPYVY